MSDADGESALFFEEWSTMFQHLDFDVPTSTTGSSAQDPSDAGQDIRELSLVAHHPPPPTSEADMGIVEDTVGISPTPTDVGARSANDDEEFASSIVAACAWRFSNFYRRFGSISRLKHLFPLVDPDNDAAKTWKRRFSDRRVALILHQIIAACIFLFNLSVLLYAIREYKVTLTTGQIFGPPSDRSCSSIATYNRWLHLGINILSTALQGSSNYCAQLLAAPTREEAVQAHRKGDWFDIGIPSIRNLRKIPWNRSITWFLLMLSSAILHLTWNSAIFAAISVSSYDVVHVSHDFLSDPSPWLAAPPQVNAMRENISKLHRLDNADCIKRYINRPAGLRDVILVSANISMHDHKTIISDNPGSSLLHVEPNSRGTDWGLASAWMCSRWRTPQNAANTSFDTPVWCREELLEPASSWSVQGIRWYNDVVISTIWSRVAYCLSAGEDFQRMDKLCALRFSPIILAVVCVLSLIKSVCISYTAYIHLHQAQPKGWQGTTSRNDGPRAHLWERWSRLWVADDFDPQKAPIVTIGDAVSSFLKEDDPETRSMVLAAKEDFLRRSGKRRKPQLGLPEPCRWYHAASRRRWLATILPTLLLLVCAATGIAQFAKGLKYRRLDVGIAGLWRYGVGTTQLHSLAFGTLMRSLGQTGGFFATVFFANVFQLIASGQYLLYNSVLTSLLAAAEWNSFLVKRRTVRVSCPKGIQRSSYFLSLPFRYGIPLSLSSSILHWLISQSIFTVQTIAYVSPDFERDPTLDASVIGFSIMGLILSLILISTILIAVCSIGIFNKYDGKPYPMPLAFTCSAAISAACHAHPDDRDAHLLPLMWGFVADTPGSTSGRFCFTTARDVEWPDDIDGRLRHADEPCGELSGSAAGGGALGAV
ncbi:uncharacterized protein BKCO1_410003 [Diplodia corticola]|uniref:DUF6536 domain-containing protein n=1 Tax=Diplodia corticola TaxID=236234 RepID=A0A1J9RXA0_9PEZI|nr:uncharacterized protein BKCO1_410003 [Diplodia corticola]OJD32109.1 hypothetical protein BKCO1_410003 [Diplodia corticola]